MSVFERERKREKISSGLHAQHRAWCWAQSHKPWHYDPSQNQEWDTKLTEPPRHPCVLIFYFASWIHGLKPFIKLENLEVFFFFLLFHILLLFGESYYTCIRSLEFFPEITDPLSMESLSVQYAGAIAGLISFVCYLSVITICFFQVSGSEKILYILYVAYIINCIVMRIVIIICYIFYVIYVIYI